MNELIILCIMFIAFGVFTIPCAIAEYMDKIKAERQKKSRFKK